MKDFIWENQFLTPADIIEIVTVIPQMPFTKLRQADIDRVEEIKFFLVGDLWERAYVKSETLTRQ